ncbi:hypothetical protein KKG83_00075 [Candidatus Micrarchaeota archaeon]|nr:hypothetical protein [Candidatus Micrarchaeota archaeon]MBU2475848.1 hypothetical protein [Candidatus Micrarchaeota archaeon]
MADFKKEFSKFLKDYLISFILIFAVFAFKVLASASVSKEDAELYFMPIFFVFLFVAALKFTSPDNTYEKYGFLWNNWIVKYLFLLGFTLGVFSQLYAKTYDLFGFLELTDHYARMNAGLFIGLFSLTINEIIMDIQKKGNKNTK